ncbi:MYG1 exonuclease isoform X1 [Patella vulgata]|uniref:MYG1 exonuclease isoform X1 n=2 Tax=Patella vulgata TaxID=6465 RepID=UPI00217FEBE7|nr:MYG1 exonuclease isoform X1 [Patella vulgata]
MASNTVSSFLSSILQKLNLKMSDNGKDDEPPCKKSKIEMEKKIGTHGGNFHCDEALACFLLKQLPEYKSAEIIRTREPKILDTCDIVVDVGSVYDPEKNRFDHHQRTFKENFNSLDSTKKWVTKLSSAGLVYFHFGRQIISDILNKPKEDPITELIYDKVYENFVEEIDAVDNGINPTDETPRYRQTTGLSSRVGGLNPAWNEKQDDRDKCFEKAVALTGLEFMDRVNHYKNSWLPARDVVLTAVNNRHKIDESGEIMCFENGGAPWKDHLFSIEEELNIDPLIKYVLFADLSGQWRIQCVPLRLGTFDNRLTLPEEWLGLRGEELSEKTSIPGCVFVHANGFIGGANSYEGVLEMARKSLQLHKQKTIS